MSTVSQPEAYGSVLFSPALAAARAVVLGAFNDQVSQTAVGVRKQTMKLWDDWKERIKGVYPGTTARIVCRPLGFSSKALLCRRARICPFCFARAYVQPTFYAVDRALKKDQNLHFSVYIRNLFWPISLDGASPTESLDAMCKEIDWMITDVGKGVKKEAGDRWRGSALFLTVDLFHNMLRPRLSILTLVDGPEPIRGPGRFTLFSRTTRPHDADGLAAVLTSLFKFPKGLYEAPAELSSTVVAGLSKVRAYRTAGLLYHQPVNSDEGPEEEGGSSDV